MRYIDRIMDTKNPFLESMANLQALPINVEKAIELGNDIVLKIQSFQNEYIGRGNTEDLGLYSDMTKLTVLTDPKKFGYDEVELLKVVTQLQQDAIAIKNLGFTITDSIPDFNILQNYISNSLILTSEKIFDNFIAWADNRTVDDQIGEIILETIKDLIEERMSPEWFCIKNELEIPEGMTARSFVLTNYFNAYDEVLEVEANRIIDTLIPNTRKTVIINPMNMDKIKELLVKAHPGIDPFFVQRLTIDMLEKQDTIEYMNRFVGDEEDRNAFARAVIEFMEEHKTEDAMEVMGYKEKVLHSVDMATIVYHTMILASAEIRDENVKELSESTEYVADILREVLEAVPDVEYSHEAPYKILSVISNYTQLITARSTIMRAMSLGYLSATRTIGDYITKYEDSLEEGE